MGRHRAKFLRWIRIGLIRIRGVILLPVVMFVIAARHYEKRIGNDIHILHTVIGHNIVFLVPRPGKERLDVTPHRSERTRTGTRLRSDVGRIERLHVDLLIRTAALARHA